MVMVAKCGLDGMLEIFSSVRIGKCHHVIPMDRAADAASPVCLFRL
jgi:hypothetical protein